MDVYVARQPIFDRNMNIFGYELLYRRSSNNFYEGIDDQQATAELINNAYLVISLDTLTDGTKAFINFSEELLEKAIPMFLPKENVVVEILERVKPTASVIRACNNLKENGYILALDDFGFDEDYSSLIEIADIIKVEFAAVDYHKQRQMIQYYKKKSNIKFLAEKIETREEHRIALEMGYDLFQGYFFSKPVIVKGEEIGEFPSTVIQVVNELNQEEPNFQVISEIIERDLDLTYKLLKIMNSVSYGSRYKINSIKQALVRFGINEIRKWMYLILLKETKNMDNRELIKVSLIRGKCMELLSIEMGVKQKHSEFFLTGLFSAIDMLLNKTMPEVVGEMALTSEVKEALLGKNNELRQVLDCILLFEQAKWNQAESQEIMKRIDKEIFMDSYLKALDWANELDY